MMQVWSFGVNLYVRLRSLDTGVLVVVYSIDMAGSAMKASHIQPVTLLSCILL